MAELQALIGKFGSFLRLLGYDLHNSSSAWAVGALRRLATMRQPRSIRFHLSAVCFFFFLLVIVLGLFTISRLSEFNKVAAGIADLWLPNTRALGDLNNFTSDYPGWEGRYVLSADDVEMAAIRKEIDELDQSVSQAQHRYEMLPHDGVEANLYAQFKAQWKRYRGVLDHVLELSHANRKSEANTLFMTSSRSAYDAASDTLGQLTDLNVASARAASTRVAVAHVQALWLIGIAIVVAGVIVVATLLYIRRWISDPILRLADTMHRLVAREVDVDIHGTERRDEIGEMARAAVVFRDNAIELMVSQRGLAQQASMLEEKLAAERHLTMLQRNFVSMASHEFRTPLTIIDAHAQRLVKLNKRLPAEEITERAGKIRAAVLGMTHLMENLLNSSRLVDSGTELYFHPVDMDLAELLREVCRLHREISPKAQILQRLGANPLIMVGDAKLLFQVFSNILANAIKYSPGGGLIKFNAEVAADQIVVTIEDNGIGIPEKDLARLFDRYFRASNVSGMVGTGVGLYLVRMVVALHDGDVSVESKEGEGSRFTVRLPARKSTQASVASPRSGSESAQSAEPVARGVAS
jgi:two-component system, OmpR family, sensor kinase